MMKIIGYSLFPLFLALVFTLPVYAAYEVKDSYYFMKDDGEFSPEEKDEEAQYVYEECERNAFQKIYYDCGCIAGAFRQERDKEKLIPQGQIVSDLFDNKELGCANTTAIAGNTYEFCNEFAKVFRSRKKNNQQYCECVANKVAHDFTKEPRLRTRYMEKLRSNAMLSCKK